MSLTAIVNLAERLLNNSSGQTADANSGSKQSKPIAHGESDFKSEDQFSPSAIAAQQNAGLFQVKQSSFFSAAADFLLSQTAQPQVNPAAAQTPAATPQAALAASAHG